MTVEIIDTKELRRLAQAATPGPWRFEDVGHKYVVSKSGDGYISREVCKMDSSTMSAFRNKENGPFIAAANPTTIEVLLDRIQLLEQQNATLLAVLRRAGDAIEALDGTSVTNERLVDDYHAALAIRSSGRAVPVGAIGTILTEVMNIASKNGADSRSMPDEYVEVAAWLCGVSAPSAPEGGKLVLIEPTSGMMRGAHRLVAAARRVLASADSQGLIRLDESGDVASELRSALAAAQEGKP